MTDTKLDVPGLLALLETVIEEAPDKANTTRACYYKTSYAYGGMDSEDAVGGPAHCIAGQVIYRLGGMEALDELREAATITLHPTLDDHGDRVLSAVAQEKVDNNSLVALRFMTEDALNVLRVAQYEQDHRMPWGAALAAASREV